MSAFRQSIYSIAMRTSTLLLCLSLTSTHAAETASDNKGLPPHSGSKATEGKSAELRLSSLFSLYSDGLRADARAGLIKPIIGRTNTVREINSGILENGKVVLVGDSSSGRNTTIMKWIIENTWAEVYRLNADAIADIPRAEQGRWISAVIKEINSIARQSTPGTVGLFIENFDQYIDGKGDSSAPSNAIAKEIIFQRQGFMIIESTPDAYLETFMADPKLEKRVKRVDHAPPNYDILIQELRSLKSSMESTHRVRIPDATLIRLAEIFAKTPGQEAIRGVRQALTTAIQMAKQEFETGVTEGRRLLEARVPLASELTSVTADHASEPVGPEKEALARKIEELKTQISDLDEKIRVALTPSATTEANIMALESDIHSLTDDARDIPQANDVDGKTKGNVFLRLYSNWRIQKATTELLDAKDSITGTQGDQAAPDKAKVGPKHIEMAAGEILRVAPELFSLNIEANVARIPEIKGEIYNQDEAVDKIAMALDDFKKERDIDARASIAEGKEPSHKPIGAYILAGDTGIGKTELVKAVGRKLGVPESGILTIDFATHNEAHSVSRLIGSPPGYVGFKEPGKLTEGVRSRPFTILLGDEFGKEHPDVSKIFMRINDEGILEDSARTTVHFDNVLEFFTTNEGQNASHMSREQLLEFFNNPLNNAAPDSYDRLATEDLRVEYVRHALIKVGYRPEFLARFTIIVMNPHTSESIARLAHFHLRKWINRVQMYSKIKVVVSDAAIGHLVSTFRRQGGARIVIDAVKQRFREPFRAAVRAQEIKAGDTVFIDAVDGARPTFTKVPAGEFEKLVPSENGRDLPKLPESRVAVTKPSTDFDPKASLTIFKGLFNEDFMLKEAVAKALRRFGK